MSLRLSCAAKISFISFISAGQKEGNGGRRWKMDDGRRKRNCGSWLMVHDEWFMICFESMG
jgi:hypothetical protein